MKKAVAYLLPFMEEEKRLKALAEGKDPNEPVSDTSIVKFNHLLKFDHLQ
jgi:hypothetical protein